MGTEANSPQRPRHFKSVSSFLIALSKGASLPYSCRFHMYTRTFDEVNTLHTYV